MILSPQRESQHRFLVLQTAAVIDPRTAVAVARNEHAIKPALHDRGHAEPVDWEIENDQVGTLDLVQLRENVRRQRARGIAVALLKCIHQVITVGALVEVICTGDRVEFHRIQI
ncbi:hypothetical protein D9M71_826590 [compost metagenome]